MLDGASRTRNQGNVMKMKILAVGAHPDDVEIGMGGTVASLVRQGHDVMILDLTDGEPTPHGSPEIRSTESAEAARILGARRKTLGMPNRFLVDTIENRKVIAAEIRAFKPDYLFAPYPADAHPDHIAAGELAQAARFYAKLTKSDIPGEPCFPQRLISYFPVHVRLRIEPSFINDISDFMEIKEAAIRCYQSQFQGSKTDYIEIIMNENRYWGFQAGYQAGFKGAEPFSQQELPALKSWPAGYV